MVHYSLGWSDPHDRLYDVTIRFAAPSEDPLLLLPAWRPGRYLMQNYAANVREWTAGGRPVTKVGKSSWRVQAAAGEEVSFTYRYFAGVLDAGSSFLDDDEAYFNGSNLFMLVDGLRSEEHLLEVQVPSGWLLESQLQRNDSGALRARSYDHLIDSPVIASPRLTRHSTEAHGATLHLVFRGDEGLDTARFTEPVRRIAETQGEIFGGLPFDEYRFLIHLRDRWHGVEHEDSCSIIANRAQLEGAEPGEEPWDHFLSIVSHELFHAWNVKRIVPAAFSPYDYWLETPTRLLWAMEGTTSYYGDLSLVRSGLWNAEMYVRHLQQTVEALEAQPAKNHLSLAQASWDGWLAEPGAMHDLPNAWFSFYTKGEVVSVLLDLEIRRRSENGRSLDDVMRLLWERYGKSASGLPEEGFEAAVAEIADVGDFFSRYVEGTDPLPYEELFATAGITFASTVRDPEISSLAIRTRQVDGRLMVDAPIRGGAGMQAGLLAGDELLSLGETRVNSDAALQQALYALPIGAQTSLRIVRAGRVQELRVTGKYDPRPSIRMKIEKGARQPDGWLGRRG